MLLLESWRDFEGKYGDDASQAKIAEMMPRRVKKRRLLTDEQGTDAGWEEYHDYIFPDEGGQQSNLKLLEMAQKWKRQKTTSGGDSGS